jgi:hypothetical protein
MGSAMTVPEDTSGRDPLLHLAGSWDDPSEYITDMEAAGQRQLVASSVLPRDRGGDAEYEALGFVFGAVVDDLFQQATLPLGWSKRGTDHDMHSEVLDERGIPRAGVFYKAAFYDRKASMNLIDVGGHLADHAIYGADPVSGPWEMLTDNELADVIDSAEQYKAQAAKNPDIYGKRLPRVLELVAQVEAARAAR